MKVNKSAYDKAVSLIESGKYILDSDWSAVQPSAEDENAFIEKHGWDAFADWHLAIDPEETESKDTKGRYKFPYGDFDRIHRDGVIAIKQRAAQHDYNHIVEAADKLMQMLDERDVVEEASEESFPASDPPNYRDRR